VVAPLKLKRQKSAAVAGARPELAENNPLAKVLVKTPVSYLEDIYDYVVPETLTELVTVGSVVKIEYGHVKTEGLVIERTSGGSNKLKNIEDVLGWPGMIKPEVVEHLQKVVARFGGSFWNLLDSYLPAIPGKLSNSDKFTLQPYSGKTGHFFENLISQPDLDRITTDHGIRYSINQPLGFKPYEILFELISLRINIGQVLIIASDFREFDYIKSVLQSRFGENFNSYDTRKGKKERFYDFEVISKAEPRIILGNRSSSFLPLAEKSSIFVVNDCDPSHYELRAPGWNSRDVSLLRGGDSSLFFYSATPSYEIERLVELKWISKLEIRSNSQIQYFVSNGGDSYIPVIKNALSMGNVLVSVAARGYANVFLCSKCRNPANCKCGGRLRIKSANTNPSCYLCNKEYKNWNCSECGESKPFVISKGLERTAEEIARAIPSAKVMKTIAESATGDLPEKGQVIVSSRGAEPIDNYAAVILLDGENLFNQPTLRAEEMLKHTWFDLMSRVVSQGAIYISLLNNHPLTQQLLLKQSSSIASLQNRKEAKLPPYYRICQVTGNLAALSAFAENLRNSKICIISNVTSVNADLGKLVIRVDVDHGQELVEIMQDIVKMQGVKSKPIFEYRFDQYDL
jgi:primosomal protein N' (replication factor Y)